jgi:hypothetical protein
MAYSLLYVVGNSDIKVNNYQRFGEFLNLTRDVWSILEKDEGIEIIDSGFRLSGEEKIQIDKEKEDLFGVELPLFIPIMNGVCGDCHTKPDKIYLFGTRQPHHQDTIYAAQIIKHFINKKYKISEDYIVIEKIEKNPSDYDQMADYFRDFFQKNSQLKNNVVNYISLTAGTPAETVNIALGSMDIGNKYLYLPHSSAQCKEVKLLSRLNRQKYASIIRELIKNYQYESALHIAEESPYGSNKKSNIRLLTLLRVMRRRILFDFEGALKESRKMESTDQPIQNLTNSLSSLSQLEEMKIIEELVYRVELSFRKKDYLEGIALLFSLIENFLQYQFTKSTGKKIEKINGRFGEYNAFIREKSYIEDKDSYIDKPNRPNLRKLLSLVSKYESSSIEGIETINDFIDRLEKPQRYGGSETSILDLRNNGPYAHGNTGVTEELLKKIYPPHGDEGIVYDLKRCIEPLCPSLTTNPFDIINGVMLGLLEAE